LKTIQKFFPLLEKKRWAKAEKILKLTTKNAGDDEWKKGYIHALSGMIIALKVSYSPPQPYIVSLKEFSKNKGAFGADYELVSGTYVSFC